MNAYVLILVLVIFCLMALGGLVYYATLGIGWAIFTLGAIVATVLVGIGLAYNLIASKLLLDNQQKQFLSNAKENLGIMSAMQTVQNQQNSALLKQIKSQPMLPPPNGGIIIEEDIFDNL
jgi:hypothetical protein